MDDENTLYFATYSVTASKSEGLGTSLWISQSVKSTFHQYVNFNSITTNVVHWRQLKQVE